MSLATRAMCLCVVEALKGRTIAGDRIADSEIGTLADMISDDAAPVVIVSFDEADGEMADGLLNAEHVATMLIEVAIAAKVSLPAKAPGDEPLRYIEYMPTSAALETAIDILWRQIQRCLLTPYGGEWSDLWRRLQTPSQQAEFHVKRGGDENGVRFASRYYLIDLSPVSDPDFGIPIDEPWTDLLAAMRAAGADLTNIADTFQEAIEGTDGLADWRTAQARLGISEESVRGLGIAPPYEGDPEQPPAIDSYEAFVGVVDTVRADEIAEPEEDA